jgi:hypothetical protein
MLRHLSGQDQAHLQTVRDQALSATADDFRAFAQAVRINAEHGAVCVLGDSLAMENSGLELTIGQVL